MISKIKLCGNVLKVYNYSKDTNKLNNNVIKNEDIDNKIKYVKLGERFKNNLIRAKNNLIDLIDCNITEYSKFLTLTFRENITDYKYTSKCINSFFTNLRQNYNYNFKFVWVRETQKRGAIHFHIVLFYDNKIDIEILKKVWSYGFIKINVIDDYKNISRYVSKYIVKSFLNDYLNDTNIRCYSCSKGLKRPLEFKSDISYLPMLEPRYTYKYKCDLSKTYVIYDEFELDAKIKKLYEIFGDKLLIV